jgi:hypothetical protein
MTTGYTNPVQSGEITEFNEFAMTCARAFGALITMRDDPTDAPIPEEFPAHTSYYDDQIAAAKIALAELPSLGYGECVARANAEYDAALASHAARAKERELHRQRYETMLAKATEWKPPTSEHAGLRAFMIEQLSTSINHDCSGQYDTPPKRLTGDEWREAQLRRAERDLSYGTEQRDKEIARTAGRNEWLRQLRASLKA